MPTHVEFKQQMSKGKKGDKPRNSLNYGELLVRMGEGEDGGAKGKGRGLESALIMVRK